MKKNSGFIASCFLLTFFTLISLLESHYDSSIFDLAPVLIGVSLGPVLFFIAFFRFFRFKELPVPERLIPFYYWLASVLIIAVFDRWQSRIEYTPNFMHVSSGSDFNVDGFTLKQDGQYIYWAGSGLGEYRNYGTYILKDSIITLSPSTARNAPRQTRLLIRPFSASLNPAFTQRSKIYLIDKEGRTTKYDSGYNIVEFANN